METATVTTWYLTNMLKIYKTLTQKPINIYIYYKSYILQLSTQIIWHQSQNWRHFGTSSSKASSTIATLSSATQKNPTISPARQWNVPVFAVEPPDIPTNLYVFVQPCTAADGDYWRLLNPGEYKVVVWAEGYFPSMRSCRVGLEPHPTICDFALTKTPIQRLKELRAKGEKIPRDLQLRLRALRMRKLRASTKAINRRRESQVRWARSSWGPERNRRGRRAEEDSEMTWIFGW